MVVMKSSHGTVLPIPGTGFVFFAVKEPLGPWQTNEVRAIAKQLLAGFPYLFPCPPLAIPPIVLVVYPMVTWESPSFLPWLAAECLRMTLSGP